MLAYAKEGDIYTADPVTGTPTAVVKGPETDLRPVFSLDGTRLAFERRSAEPAALYVAKADGTGVTRVTREYLNVGTYAFSPDGKEILILASGEDSTTLWIAASDGSGIRPLTVVGMIPQDPIYRAPDGREIVFAGTQPAATVAGLYAVKTDGSGLRTIVEPTNLDMWEPRSAPDGQQIAYTAMGVDSETNDAAPWWRVYVVGADGGAPRLLRDALRPAGDWESAVAWSNDGKRLLTAACYRSEGATDCPSTFVVVTVDGTKPDVKIDVAEGFPGAGRHPQHVGA